MNNSQSYDFNRYISIGESYEKAARNRESQRDFMGAKNFYFDAISCYESAEKIAWQAGDTSSANYARRKIESAKNSAREMSYKYDAAVRDYLGK